MLKPAVQIHNQGAAEYDRRVREYHSFAADVLFGLSFEYVHPGERLLDLGIGTGLSALPFARLGLEVFGADASLEMLNLCRTKDIAVELAQFDLEDTPWRYANSFFHHAISCGVLHFVSDLDPIFQEAARVLRAGGMFAFTTKAPPGEKDEIVEQTNDGVSVFMHGTSYIEHCAADHGFTMQKDLNFVIGNKQAGYSEMFIAFVLRKMPI